MRQLNRSLCLSPGKQKEDEDEEDEENEDEDEGEGKRIQQRGVRYSMERLAKGGSAEAG